MERIQKVSGILIACLMAFAGSPSLAQNFSDVSAQDTGTDFVSFDENAEFDPYDPRAEEILEEYDRIYEQETGQAANIKSTEEFIQELVGFASCRRADCPVWVQIVRSTQKMYLYINGRVQDSWAVSTGISGHGTPSMDSHPNGRIYDKYTSRTYPGGDYNGLGNMPYAVFIRGPFAMHGTPRSNWSKLGKRASKGCIRMHPDNAYKVNRLVRSHGIRNVWVTVQ